MSDENFKWLVLAEVLLVVIGILVSIIYRTYNKYKMEKTVKELTIKANDKDKNIENAFKECLKIIEDNKEEI